MPTVATTPTVVTASRTIGVRADVAEALLEVAHDRPSRVRPGDPVRHVERLVVHQAQPDDDGEEAHRIDGEGGPDAERGDGQTGERRADDAGAVEHGRVEGDRVADVLAPDELDRERLADRHVDGVGDPEQEGQHEDHPDLDDVGEDEDGQDRGEDHHRGLGRDQDASLGQRIGGDPGEQAEDDDRDELGGGHDAEPDRVVGQLEDEPRLGDLLHPGADQRDRLAAEEQPVVAVLERAHRLRFHQASRVERGAVDHDRPRVLGSASPSPAPGAWPGRRRVRPDGRRGAGPRPCLLDHRRQAGRLRLEDLDLVVGAGAGFEEERAPLVAVAGLAEALAVALARGVVLEQLADLREREAGVVAQAADELEPVEVRGVVEAVVAVRAGGRREQADLFVVADRAGRQAGLGRDLVDAQEAGLGVAVRRGQGRLGGGLGTGHLPAIIPQP